MADLHRVRIHLVGGGTVEGKPNPLVVSQSEAQESIAYVMSGGDGWQLNCETAEGWACIPKHSVLYLEIVPA